VRLLIHWLISKTLPGVAHEQFRISDRSERMEVLAKEWTIGYHKLVSDLKVSDLEVSV
jgi:hypothetical protein